MACAAGFCVWIENGLNGMGTITTDKRASFAGKRGVTLVEVLVVVAIMGILSGIGVAGLQSAVANSRIKDAGINVTAFMQRAANEATRLNSKVCVWVAADNKTMNLYGAACDASSLGTPIDNIVLESGNVFTTAGGCPINGIVPYVDKKVTLTPKIGVSPIPVGCFLIQYGNSDRMAGSIKLTTKFAMDYMLSYDGGTNWFEP